jgi:hypothetical protein
MISSIKKIRTVACLTMILCYACAINTLTSETAPTLEATYSNDEDDGDSRNNPIRINYKAALISKKKNRMLA